MLTRVNALMLRTHIPSSWLWIPATHSASQTRVNALLLSRGAPRGDERKRISSPCAACQREEHTDEKIVRSRDLAGQARVFTRGHCRRRGPHHLHRRTYRPNG